MKAVRNTFNQHKGFFTLWLVVVFFAAANARNVVPVFQDHNTSEHTSESGSGKHFLSAVPDDANFNSLSAKDTDVDDVDFIYYNNYPSIKAIVLSCASHNISSEGKYVKSYNVPLYDLYCNWKFHLS